jgi:hypothetical protein
MLVAMRLRAGWPGEKALEGVEFGSDFVRDVARGLVGDASVSHEAKAEAQHIATWAGVPTT